MDARWGWKGDLAGRPLDVVAGISADRQRQHRTGYENFVARIDSGEERRPSWMGTVDFAAMKMKLMGSIIAISAIALLRTFMKLEEGKHVEPELLRMMAVIHGLLLVSALVLAITERLARTSKAPPP